MDLQQFDGFLCPEHIDSVSILENGTFTVQFTPFNRTISDMISSYLRNILSFSAVKNLEQLDVFPPLNCMTLLNVFTNKAYNQFLQMICIEDYHGQHVIHRTTHSQVILGTEVDIKKLPVIRNTSYGRKVFDNIHLSPYSVFSDKQMWLVKINTQYIEKGVRRELEEYNLFVPSFALL